MNKKNSNISFFYTSTLLSFVLRVLFSLQKDPDERMKYKRPTWVQCDGLSGGESRPRVSLPDPTLTLNASWPETN